MDKEALPFETVASVNMAADASDQTFISALRNALPWMRYQPHFEVSMEGVFVILVWPGSHIH
jgi:hypothetical protein